MIYDCLITFNELDLLEIRLNVLKDVVDKFVVIEGTKTHTGKSKPLHFAENREKFVALVRASGEGKRAKPDFVALSMEEM